MKTIDSLSSSDGLESAIRRVLNKMLVDGTVGVVQDGSGSNTILTLPYSHSTTSVPTNIIISDDNEDDGNFEAKDLPLQDKVSVYGIRE
mmetsp:Transcript_33114/g.58019  ORF Transcript_33114/g.58019 Transcript_33114/m.58019 type:complete len:89 (+) Transcript_33114:42-308(+)